MSQVEVADGVLRLDELVYGIQVWEADDGFCTRLIMERGDMPVGYVIHHGKDEVYSGKIPPLFIQGQVTVGEALQESERHRHDLRWHRRAEEMRQSSTLFQDALTADEEARLFIKGRSTFGSEVAVQRNADYSQETTRREWWAERARRTKQTKHYRVQKVRA